MARSFPMMTCIAMTLLVLAACAAGQLCGTDANRLRTRSCGARKSRVAECCTGYACGAKHTCVPTCALLGCLPPICPDGTVPPIVKQATGIYPDCCPHYGECPPTLTCSNVLCAEPPTCPVGQTAVVVTAATGVFPNGCCNTYGCTLAPLTAGSSDGATQLGKTTGLTTASTAVIVVAGTALLVATVVVIMMAKSRLVSRASTVVLEIDLDTAETTTTEI